MIVHFAAKKILQQKKLHFLKCYFQVLKIIDLPSTNVEGKSITSLLFELNIFQSEKKV